MSQDEVISVPLPLIEALEEEMGEAVGLKITCFEQTFKSLHCHESPCLSSVKQIIF
jgi:hypothetical protein